MMEFKTLTDKQFEAARTYVPLMDKVAFVNACAVNCFDRMEVKLTSGEKIPFHKESVERRSRYLMGALLTLYFGIEAEFVEGEDFLLAADEYDRWAGGHIINQIERFKGKGDANRDKAFNLLADFRELEKMFKTEVYGMLQAMNDPVSRFQEMTANAMAGEILKSSLGELQQAQNELTAFADEQERKAERKHGKRT